MKALLRTGVLLLLLTACGPANPPAGSTGRAPVEPNELLRQNDSLRSALAALKGEQAAAGTATTRTLRRYQLPTHPIELGDYLQKEEPALLPAGGTLGSKLHIETARPLEGNHVFVTGSDGHNYRYWLLEYKAQMGTGINWKRVWISAPL